MLFGDWRDTRAAIERAYEKLGRVAGTNGIERADWNLVDESIKAFREAQAFKCVECGEITPYGKEIRCLDCRATLCERCAPRHFWPNGRPPKTHP